MLIKIKDYERIWQIISAVIESEEANPAYACLLYSLFGAHILHNHFKINSKVRCGLAIYQLGDEDQVLCFGEKTPSGVTSTYKGFHSWIEAKGWLIDFMSPEFGRAMNTNLTAKRRMIQKRLSDMARHPNDMTRAGEFFLEHNPQLSKALLMPVVEQLVIQDLAKLCSLWFKKTPEEIPTSVESADQHGKIRPITLNTSKVLSSWQDS